MYNKNFALKIQKKAVVYLNECTPSQSVNPALNKNQSEFGILVLPVALKVLPDGNSLLDHVVQVLWNLRS